MSERRDELNELLVRRALYGLDAEETRRLNELTAAFPEVDPDWADAVVGELDADTVEDEAHALGAALREALLSDAPPPRLDASRSRPANPSRPGESWGGWAGWGVAAVLAALLAVQVGSGPAASPGAPSNADAARAAAVERSFDQMSQVDDAVVAAWAPGGHSSGDGVTGAVAWSSTMQAGIMRLAGLAPNAAGLQYQLWIFDAERDERFPVDGGVFDVPGGTEVVEVPIDARLPVARPTLFAVTLEPAGGVVVSDRSRLSTVATLED